MWNKLRFKHYAVIFLLMVISFETTAIAVDKIRNQRSDLAFSVETNFKNNYFVEKFKVAELKSSVNPPKFTFKSINGLKRDIFITTNNNKVETENISLSKESKKTNPLYHDLNSAANTNSLNQNKFHVQDLSEAQSIQDYVEYKLNQGDTIAKIAKVFGVKSDDLKILNQIKDERLLKVGTIIKVPVKAQKFVYTVKEGDSLAKIANKFKVSMQDLIEANNLKSYKLQEDQKIIIPVPLSKYSLVKINYDENLDIKNKNNNVSVFPDKSETQSNTQPNAMKTKTNKENGESLVNNYKITNLQDTVLSNIKNKVDSSINPMRTTKNYTQPIETKAVLDLENTHTINMLKNSKNAISNYNNSKENLKLVSVNLKTKNEIEPLNNVHKVYRIDKVSTRLKISSNFFQLPIKSYTLTDMYGWRHHPIYRKRLFHAGIDLSAPKGTPIYAAGSGQVVYAGWRPGYGKLIIIKHPNGLTTRYGHCSHIRVKIGQMVKTGEIIGNVGQTGTATGPHLHFEVRRNGKTLNPAFFIRELRHHVH